MYLDFDSMNLRFKSQTSVNRQHAKLQTYSWAILVHIQVNIRISHQLSSMLEAEHLIIVQVYKYKCSPSISPRDTDLITNAVMWCRFYDLFLAFRLCQIIRLSQQLAESSDLYNIPLLTEV